MKTLLVPIFSLLTGQTVQDIFGGGGGDYEYCPCAHLSTPDRTNNARHVRGEASECVRHERTRVSIVSFSLARLCRIPDVLKREVGSCTHITSLHMHDALRRDVRAFLVHAYISQSGLVLGLDAPVDLGVLARCIDNKKTGVSYKPLQFAQRAFD